MTRGSRLVFTLGLLALSLPVAAAAGAAGLDAAEESPCWMRGPAGMVANVRRPVAGERAPAGRAVNEGGDCAAFLQGVCVMEMIHPARSPASVQVGMLLAGVALLVVGVAALRSRSGPGGWWGRLRGTRQRVLAEDALKHIHAWELRRHPATPDSLAGALGLRPRVTLKLVAWLEGQGWVRSSADGLSLTPDGERVALQVIRAHRLLERYLVDEARMSLAAVHAEAERREHTQSAEALDALEAAMGHPTTDPHGDPIPTAAGEVAKVASRAVTDWPAATPARIVHLEDEPRVIFAQIAAEGFRPGQTIWVVESDARRVVLSDGDETHILAPVVAANIFVASVEPEEPRVERPRLTSLKPGERATVHELDEALRGFTRRRLLDLGLTPGVAITAEMSGIFRDPVAYRVRGSLIALRRDQAEHVVIKIDGKEGADRG